MDKKAMRSFGKMETWEPDDKSFSKHMFKEGEGTTTPNEGSVCVLHFSLVGEAEIAEDDLAGYKFGSETEVTIGEGDTVLSEFLDNVVITMKAGEVCYIKAKVDAKGAKVNELELKNQGLKINATLFSFSRAADSSELEQDERLERAQHHKDKGTELFQKARMDFSIKRYNKALQYLTDIDPSQGLPPSLMEQYDKLRCQCHLNLAACFLKMEEYDQVIEHCGSALELEPKNVKGLFRRGQAYIKSHKYDLAKIDLAKAQELEPQNKAVSTQLRNVNDLMKKEKQLYQKMFT